MKITVTVVFLFIIFNFSYSKNVITYLDPVPDAGYVSIGNNIVIGFEKPTTLSKDKLLKCIFVNGTKSNMHTGSIIITSDNKKIIFTPDTPYQYGERIDITIKGELLKLISTNEKEYTYSFYTSVRKPDWNELNNIKEEFQIQNINNDNIMDVPQLTVLVNNNPSDGYLFLTPYNSLSYLVITNKNGIPYRVDTKLQFCGDFKKQKNEHYTYFNGQTVKHYELDSSFNTIDSFYCGNGYTTDIHELLVLNNGHALIMAYDPQIVNMGPIVQGGDTAAVVIGLIIQEVDKYHNVVFQWRSWDHFEITDALHENLLAHNIDAVHGNSIEVDNDGNIIISSRHLDEITKINRSTGSIIWRFGGLNNQFTYLNDSIPFHYQHAARRISNGNLTLYDNGNFHTPHYSRAAEYHLDEVNKTAELVWQYVPNPIIFGNWGGYVQRLPGGNTLIGWGGTIPTVTEVDSNGTVKFEALYAGGIYSYRVYKFSLSGIPVQAGNGQSVTPESFSLEQNYPNPFNPSTKIEFNVAKLSFVELSVFDITGREIKKIVSEVKQPGNYTAVFDGSNLSSGIYVYKYTSGNYSETRKMILLK